MYVSSLDCYFQAHICVIKATLGAWNVLWVEIRLRMSIVT